MLVTNTVTYFLNFSLPSQDPKTDIIRSHVVQVGELSEERSPGGSAGLADSCFCTVLIASS